MPNFLDPLWQKPILTLTGPEEIDRLLTDHCSHYEQSLGECRIRQDQSSITDHSSAYLHVSSKRARRKRFKEQIVEKIQKVWVVEYLVGIYPKYYYSPHPITLFISHDEWMRKLLSWRDTCC